MNNQGRLNDAGAFFGRLRKLWARGEWSSKRALEVPFRWIAEGGAVGVLLLGKGRSVRCNDRSAGFGCCGLSVH